MSGDYSRWSFDPRRHFAAVLMQQGRVHTDADWNEWAATLLRRVQAGTLDTLGPAVVPRETPDGFLIQAAGGTFTIGPGRIYVDGLLAENHGSAPDEFEARLAELRGTAATPYDAQPYLPEPPALPGGGPHLVYLKVWQRERTAVEDPRLVEPALGVDTTTRLQTVWQVRVLPDVGGDVTCATPLADIPGFAAAEPAAAGRLTTGTAEVPGEPDPCLVPPSGDYKGENQLFRVQIHRGGDFAGTDRATFKWSRDNATVASRVTEIPALDRIVVESTGRDAMLRFADGDWIEITDDWRELAGVPGEMRRIRSGGGVDDATRTILLETPLPAGAFPVDAQFRTAPARNTRVVRWDQRGRVLDAGGGLLVDLDAPGANGTIPVPSSATSVLLEHGVVVTFHLEPATGDFRTGDYWIFAARAADASVEILDRAPPRGVHAHYAKLALVAFPEDETDCRTLWPPEAAEGGCDCSVCVTPESHASGALTIQAAVEQVKEAGGTVCLGAGTYALREPLRIVEARSLRLRGQGWATVLVAAAGGEAVEVAGSIGVRIEHLAVVSATPQGDASAVTLRNSMGVAVQDSLVLNLSQGDGRGPAIGLDGYLIGAAVERCALAAHTGIAGGRRDDGYLATARLHIADCWLWCTRRGVDLGRFSVHLAETRIAGNTAWGCREAGLAAVGGNVATAGTFNVTGNLLNVAGDGIVVGVDAARIGENDVRRAGNGAGDGIALVRGLDPGGIDYCQILGNRVHGVPGHGIAIRTRIVSGMIKHNVIAETGGAGIAMEADGEAGQLVVENNQLLDVARAANVAGAHPAALRFVGVRELDVAANAVHGFARDAQQAASRAGLSVVATAAARVGANRLTGIAPPAGFVGQSAAIEVLPPFRSAALVDNTLRRRGPDTDKLASGAWIGVHVRAAAQGASGSGAGLIALGDLAVALAVDRAFVFTATNAFAVPVAAPGEVSVRGNEVIAEATDAAPVLVAAAQGCQLNDNRISAPAGRGAPSLLRCARAIVGNNDLRGAGDLDVLRVELSGKTVPAILGNLRTGRILVNGAPLGDPWAALNPASV
ncbi:MAG: hypothetical protein KJ025_02820 [Burkholderiales bacterium]|nr:hypothetical protein [Burkholderiales bacterium]